MERIIVRGARQNNLKNIDLDLPRKSLLVVSGVSGSGKSSLVFDTLYQESRRRFFETLPTYVLQFMERLPRPDFEAIEGLSPAVAVEQRNPVHSSRSTVGTITEIYDYLRLLFARAGTTVCPSCGAEVAPDTPDSVCSRLIQDCPSQTLTVTFSPALSERVSLQTVRDSLLAMGFVRARVGGLADLVRLDEESAVPKLEAGKPLYVVVDRLPAEETARTRLAESVETAFQHGEGSLRVYCESGAPVDFSDRFHCAACDRYFPEPTPNLFSFNNPYGACPTCRGFGNLLDYDPALIVPDASLSLAEGALDPWAKPRYVGRRARLASFCREENIDLHKPWSELGQAEREVLMHGAPGFQGVFPFLRSLERKKYKQYIRFFLRRYQSEHDCPECRGTRLRPAAADVLVAGCTIGELTAMNVDELADYFARLPSALSASRWKIASDLVREVSLRLGFLQETGLGYLSLGRMTRTLSGGEYQRIMLTRLLGSGLTDTLFVLDEPTVGLHHRDTGRLIRVLKRLVREGNTLVVVEHDREVIAVADHLVELGPGAGDEGGELIYSGPASEFPKAGTPTARWLAGEERGHGLSQVKARTPQHFLSVKGARFRNLKNIDLEIPLGCFTCVTGVSGSGKSSLVGGVIKPGLEAHLGLGEPPGHLPLDSIEGCQHIGGTVVIDQSPIGKTPRSNPVTYVKAFDHVRRLFADTPSARRLGLKPRHFSFNAEGGRCEHCKGAGFEKIEMQFMADIFVPCEKCGGKRFSGAALKIAYRGLSIDRVLEMTVNQALEFFSGHQSLCKPLWVLQTVGLGYLRLGQSATTLSGGESQRLKIARQIAAPGGGKSHRGKLYILDEPTTGLHALEVRKLLRVLERLLENGNTVLVVEHHPEVIAHADWIIDLGPEGGEAGGELVVQGTPKQVAACQRSYTGAMLNSVFGEKFLAGPEEEADDENIPDELLADT